MHISVAMHIVRQDQRASYPFMTTAEAVEHALDTVTMDMVDDDGTETSQAYQEVLLTPHSILNAWARVSDPAWELVQMARLHGLELGRANISVENGLPLVDGQPGHQWLQARVQAAAAAAEAATSTTA